MSANQTATKPKAELFDPPRTEPTAMVPAGGNVIAMFERLAIDPNASVEKIERLMALWERGEARRAEMEWNAAMAAAQKEMRPVAADAWNPQTKSKYASYEALDRSLRPIYTKHGFGLTFDTGEGAADLFVRVLCDVVHLGGHSRRYKLDMPADGKGAKGGDVMTRTHATGSALSYGQRYLLKMVFNIAVGEEDDDGRRAGGSEETAGPKGFENWITDLESTADNGWQALSNAWNASSPEFKNHLVTTRKGSWDLLKKKAKDADARSRA
jgi:hypothetical protein